MIPNNKKNKKEFRTQKASPTTTHNTNYSNNRISCSKHVNVFLNGNNTKTAKPSPTKNLRVSQPDSHSKNIDDKTTGFQIVKKSKQFELKSIEKIIKKVPFKIVPTAPNSRKPSQNKKEMNKNNNSSAQKPSSANFVKNTVLKSSKPNLGNNKINHIEITKKSSSKEPSKNTSLSKKNLKQSLSSSQSKIKSNLIKKDSNNVVTKLTKQNGKNNNSNCNNSHSTLPFKTNTPKESNALTKSNTKNEIKSISFIKNNKTHSKSKNRISKNSKPKNKQGYYFLNQCSSNNTASTLLNKSKHNTVQIQINKPIKGSTLTSCLGTINNCKEIDISNDKNIDITKQKISSGNINNSSNKLDNKSYHPIILSLNNYNSKTSLLGVSKLKANQLKINSTLKSKNNGSHFQNKNNSNLKINIIKKANTKTHQNSPNRTKDNSNNNHLFKNLSPSIGNKCQTMNISLKASNAKTMKQKKENDSNLASISYSIIESNYFKEESMKLIDYIKSFSKSTCEYPKTTLDFYKIGRSIGHGAFGKVNLALHVLSGHIVAFKSFNKDKEYYNKNKILYEIKLMKKLRGHKSIVKLFEYIDSDKYFNIIMENVPAGNLFTYISKRGYLNEAKSKYIFKQIVETIKFMHSQGIVHRDIKPDNILLDLNNNIKLCDFGVSKEITPGHLIRDTCGTPAFIAPEVLCDAPYDPFPTDIWSSGVVLYSMLTGMFPFKGENDLELHKSILSGKFNKINEVSDDCNDLLSKILVVDPNKRIKIEEILLHPWLINTDTQFMSNKKNNFFTLAEKIIYSKMNADYRSAKKEDLVECFTNKNLITELECENQNNMSRSFIVSPYQTKWRNLDENDELYYPDLEIKDNIMMFLPKVKVLNRKYEIDYNEDADQGNIPQVKFKGRALMGSLNNSYIEEQKNKKEVHESKEDNEESNNNNEKINNMELDGILGKNKKLNPKDTQSTNSNTFIVDDNATRFVEEFGYKREYIIKSLEANEINHATACYYLKLSLLNE